MYVYIYICLYIYVYIYMSIYMCVCVYIYIYICVCAAGYNMFYLPFFGNKQTRSELRGHCALLPSYTNWW